PAPAPPGWRPGRAACRPRPARWSGQRRPPAPSARWPHTAPTSAAGCGASSVGWACLPSLARSLAHTRAGGRRLPASSPSAPSPPSSGISGVPKPQSAVSSLHRLLHATVEVIHAINRAVEVDGDFAADAPASIRRHHDLRPSLAYQRERRTSDDAACSQRRDAWRCGLENGLLHAVTLRDVADHAAEAVVQLLAG